MIDKLNHKGKSAQEVQSWASFWSKRILDSNVYQVSLLFLLTKTQPTKHRVKFPGKIFGFMISTYGSTPVMLCATKNKQQMLQYSKKLKWKGVICSLAHAGVMNLHLEDIVLVVHPDLQGNSNCHTLSFSFLNWSIHILRKWFLLARAREMKFLFKFWSHIDW